DYKGCGKAFIRSYPLNCHILIHIGEKPFICSANGCDKKKSHTKSNWKKHFACKHENLQKQYVCNFEGCKKTFKKHQQLKIHQCQHENKPLFKFNLEGCGKHFVSPCRLRGQMQVHQKNGCSFVAETWTELPKHMREIHKKEITYDVCQKTFKCEDYLKDVCQHPRDGCSRTVFNLQSCLLSFHTENHPFMCEHAGCGKRLAMKQSLTRHAIVYELDRKKMKTKVKLSSEKYIPHKRKQEQGLSLHENGESLNSIDLDSFNTYFIKIIDLG
uniref:Transcription factor IIIA n=1 Tax=Chlorocebus sabaeus TaxID=60711 RepID=A0A0D9RLQ9_CHLSB